MKRVALLLLMLLVGVLFLYLSRFWWFTDLWPRDGLFGWEALHPGGRLLGRWLRGTDFAPFELLIWAVGVFLVLTGLQSVIDRLFTAPQPEKDDADEQ